MGTSSQAHRTGQTPPEHPSDAKLVEELRDCLSDGGLICFLRDHNMWDPFPVERLRCLVAFCSSFCTAGREFSDARLGRRGRRLVKRCREFIDAVRDHTDVTSSDTVGVPRAWGEERPREVDVAVYRLNRAATRVVKAYEELLQAAAHRLP